MPGPRLDPVQRLGVTGEEGADGELAGEPGGEGFGGVERGFGVLDGVAGDQVAQRPHPEPVVQHAVGVVELVRQDTDHDIERLGHRRVERDPQRIGDAAAALGERGILPAVADRGGHETVDVEGRLDPADSLACFPYELGGEVVLQLRGVGHDPESGTDRGGRPWPTVRPWLRHQN